MLVEYDSSWVRKSIKIWSDSLHESGHVLHREQTELYQNQSVELMDRFKQAQSWRSVLADFRPVNLNDQANHMLMLVELDEFLALAKHATQVPRLHTSVRERGLGNLE